MDKQRSEIGHFWTRLMAGHDWDQSKLWRCSMELLATDGMEAFATLQTEDVDLVLSDVQMPRLDGFSLTRKIKSDPHHKDMPVILVTSFASAEDKARGIEAGADAYIAKSSFDQNKLLQTIEHLTD